MKTVKAKRPTSVKVLTINYEVHWLDEKAWIADGHDPSAIGETYRDASVIYIRLHPTGNGEDALRVTLMHEILHACTESGRVYQSVPEASDMEEVFVSLVSPILLSVLHDNPSVLAYLLATGKAA